MSKHQLYLHHCLWLSLLWAGSTQWAQAPEVSKLGTSDPQRSTLSPLLFKDIR